MEAQIRRRIAIGSTVSERKLKVGPCTAPPTEWMQAPFPCSCLHTRAMLGLLWCNPLACRASVK